ncbi:MAG TPA: YciI family protein [Thermoleophilia bacterium]|nr:YciI family protein [Thermoleophilia bacterium]
MQYMLLIYTDGEAGESWERLSETEQQAILAEYGAISQTPGVVGGAQLAPATSATTVRVQDGRTLTTDGPFAETKEVLGGFYTVEADDIDAALEVAARIPAARMGGKVEVRPLIEM